jgi:ketosteroid isomerase-like protein
MSEENVALVMRFYQEWFATGELPREFLDENVEVHDHDTPDQGVYQGIAGVERWLRDWGDAWAEWHIEIEEFIDAGETVVAVVRMHAQGMGSGVELDRQDAVVYQFRDDKLLRADYYNNKAQALEAVGLSE